MELHCIRGLDSEVSAQRGERLLRVSHPGKFFWNSSRVWHTSSQGAHHSPVFLSELK